MSVLFDGRLFADYHQVVIEDSATENVLAEYNDQTIRQRVTLTAHMLIVFTARNMPVPVKVELHPRRPPIDLAGWDHAVEASFSAPSGRIIILGLTDEHARAATAAVPAGFLRALVLSAGLATLSKDGLDGGDRYEVNPWPQPAAEVRVLKQWHEPAAG